MIQLPEKPIPIRFFVIGWILIVIMLVAFFTNSSKGGDNGMPPRQLPCDWANSLDSDTDFD